MRNNFASPHMLTCRIGCAGWNLPRHLRGEDKSYLERYAEFFNCVEINSSFYRHHKPKTYARWAETTPQEFRFSVKVPRTLTHRGEKAGPIVKRFVDEVRELGEKLGPLLIQLPPKASFSEDRARDLFSAFRDVYQGSIVCEPRHYTWFEEDALEMMANYSISLVKADPKPTLNAPEIFDQEESLYYRLHGAPRIYYSEYSEEYLDGFAKLAISRNPACWVIFDNTALGYAYQNAKYLLEAIRSGENLRPLGISSAPHSGLSRHSGRLGTQP